jgi:hypothetical protein
MVKRSNTILAIDFFTFQDSRGSVDDENFQLIRPRKGENNFYLQISKQAIGSFKSL